MRLPVTPQLSTKDGISNESARLTNTLKETAAQGDFAVVRPGMVRKGSTTGNGKGLVNFNESVISVYGANMLFSKPMAGDLLTGFVSSAIPGTPSDCYVAYGNGTYCISQKYSVAPYTAFFLVSNDTETWVKYDTSSYSKPRSLVVFGNGVFLTCLDNHPAISKNCIDWTIGSETFPNAFGIDTLSFANGYFYTHDGFGALYRSENGLNWAEVGGLSGGVIHNVCWNGVCLCAGKGVGSNINLTLVSSDGITWSAHQLPEYGSTTWISTMAVCDGYFYAIDSASPRVIKSADGVNWSFVGNYTGFSSVYGISIASDGRSIMVVYGHPSPIGTTFGSVSHDNGETWVAVDVPSYADFGYRLFDANGFFVFPPYTDTAFDYIYYVAPLYDRFKPITALSGDFFDFAQSTL